MCRFSFIQFRNVTFHAAATSPVCAQTCPGLHHHRFLLNGYKWEVSATLLPAASTFQWFFKESFNEASRDFATAIFKKSSNWLLVQKRSFRNCCPSLNWTGTRFALCFGAAPAGFWPLVGSSGRDWRAVKVVKCMPTCRAESEKSWSLSSTIWICQMLRRLWQCKMPWLTCNSCWSRLMTSSWVLHREQRGNGGSWGSCWLFSNVNQKNRESRKNTCKWDPRISRMFNESPSKKQIGLQLQKAFTDPTNGWALAYVPCCKKLGIFSL